VVVDIVVETDSKEGQLSGYVKPLFRNLKVFSLAQDVKEDNPLQFFWQALVGFATSILKNQSRDQFGTLIPLPATLQTPPNRYFGDDWQHLAHAFIRAYLPQLEMARKRSVA